MNKKTLMPLVSVNLTTHNRSHLIERALKGILNQTYKNYEIIIVDDASSDNTKEIIKKYQKRNKRIKYIRHKQNKGLATARNTALKHSKGKYIAFLDDDDEWIDKNKLQEQVEIFENDTSGKIGIVCSSVNLIKEDKSVNIKEIQKPENLKELILKGNSIIHGQTVMTKLRILKRVGGFDTNLKRGVDSDFYRTCIMKYNYEVYFMKKVTANIYEFGDDRITPQISIDSIKKNIYANKYLLKKYLRWYICFPNCLYHRIKIILASYLRLFKKRYKK